MQQTPVPTFSDFLNALYDDPIRQETSRRGRWLALLSATCIVIVAFRAQPRLDSLPFLASPDLESALPGAIALLVCLFLVEFFLRAITDIYRDKELQLVAMRYINDQVLGAMEEEANTVDRQVYDQDPDDSDLGSEPDPWWEQFFATQGARERGILAMKRSLGSRLLASRTRAIRFYLELLIPMVLAVIAIWVSGDHLQKFLLKLLEAM